MEENEFITFFREIIEKWKTFSVVQKFREINVFYLIALL